jgi:hypothetical protein
MPADATVTVSVVIAVGFVGPIVTEVGLKLQLLPGGMPEHAAGLRFIVPVKPFTEEMVSGAVPDVAPLSMVTTGFVEVRVKSGAPEGPPHPAALTRLKALIVPSPVVRS